MRPDVIHVHEPPAPTVGYDAIDATVAPLVGTFHCYSENAFSHGVANRLFGVRRKLNRLHVRIAVSEAAAWTGAALLRRRYRVIPNGVDVPDGDPAPRRRPTADPLRLAFVGQAVERKGLPVLLRAFEALREHVPVELRDRRRRRARTSRRCCSTRPASARSARSPTSASTPPSRAPTCSSRRRSAARASAWC